MSGRQELVSFYLKKLKEIKDVNVFEWLERPLERGEYPAVILRDRSTKTEMENGISYQHRLIFEIEILRNDVAKTLFPLRKTISEVVKKMSADYEGLCRCDYIQSELIAAQRAKGHGNALLIFEAKYVSDRGED